MAGRDSSEEEEHHKKRKKREKEAKAQEAQEAQLWAEKERKEKEEDKHLAWEKLINQLRREKYSFECPELANYQKNNITEEQRESINLDDHTTYLNDIWKDKSLFPHKDVMSGHQLIELLEEHDQKEKADKVWAVIEKGLNSYTPTGKLFPGDPVIKPKYFIRVIQKSNGKVMDP